MYSAGWQSGRFNKQGKFMLSHELGDYTICRDCITTVGAPGTVLLAALGKGLLWLVYSPPRACTQFTFLPLESAHLRSPFNRMYSRTGNHRPPSRFLWGRRWRPPPVRHGPRRPVFPASSAACFVSSAARAISQSVYTTQRRADVWVHRHKSCRTNALRAGDVWPSWLT